MPLDAFCLRAITQELQDAVVGLRIDKVQQPNRDQVVLLLRGGHRLLLCAGGPQPRLQLTGQLRENPAAPPMFCMLLRKHLCGGRIVSITQPGLERLAELTIDIIDEMGELGQRRLILEAMGRRSNLLLLDGDGRIIDCLRRVDFEMSAQRQLLPGLFYHYPVAPGKCDPTTEAEADFIGGAAVADGELPADRWLQNTYLGFSPLLARELVWQATGSTDTRLAQLDGAARQRLWEAFRRLVSTASGRQFVPTLLLRDGLPVDFSAVPISQYETAADSQVCESFSALLDAFFGARERAERNRQQGQELRKTASTARDRAARKLALRQQEYAQTQNRDRLRLFGELITANLWRMERGQRSLLAENYYEEALPTVEIPLDPLLTPQQNAAKYYKQYTKARTAERYLRDLIAQGETELHYLESVLEELDRAENQQDFAEIRTELQEGGYLRGAVKGKKEPKRPASKPREYTTAAGLRILVGRSNRQNEQLTLKTADKRDLWFHAQRIHGSHVILCTLGLSPDEQSLHQAAALAAYYSQAKDSVNVPVDYTPVRHVKKPAGGKPGMVIYDTCRTIYVTPELPAATAD